MFQKNDFKKAKSWLLDHNYPLDLIKYIDNFTIVDLAKLMFEAESNIAYNQDIYFKKLIERMDTASELIDIPNSINSPEDFCEWVRNYNGKENRDLQNKTQDFNG